MTTREAFDAYFAKPTPEALQAILRAARHRLYPRQRERLAGADVCDVALVEVVRVGQSRHLLTDEQLAVAVRRVVDASIAAEPVQLETVELHEVPVLPGFEREIEAADRIAKLKLTAKQKELCDAYLLDGSWVGVARRLGMSDAAVHKQVSRIRAANTVRIEVPKARYVVEAYDTAVEAA